ncbi:MAG: Hsp70 family protein [Deltaproteobacteria bacterium]|nr:Hsp70 family protein [Deltaproteobacteria bacterium]
MPAPALGLDFGTSNTAAAVIVDGKPRVLPLDPAGADVRLFRSVLFFPEEGQVMAGAEAINAYLELSEGRLLQSLKSFLPVKSFTSTSIRARSFTLEALIGLILRNVKTAIERELGEPVQKLVLGRPARFSEDKEIEGFAERRLLRAAEDAGFKDIAFRIEPLAAGLAHEATLDHEELVLTGDFGAGTSDFTVMRLSPKRHLQPDRKDDILASGGVYVAGDVIDGAVMEKKLLRKFGSEARHRPMHVGKWSEMPTHLMRKLLSWHTMSFIREKSTQVYLEDFLKSTDQPETVGALIDLVNLNLGYHLFRAIEAAKVKLSSEEKARITFKEARVDVDVSLTRAEFERIIAPLVARLEETLDAVVARAGVSPSQIDAVVLTGGTSLIPMVARIFEGRFGAEKLRRSDAFSSVAEGLAAAAAAG